MFRALDISTSGLVAQRTRLDAIAGNIANVTTAGKLEGGPAPYARRMTVFEPGDGQGGPGVHVAEVVADSNPPKAVSDPNHPFADANGMVYYPNIDLPTEMVDAMLAARAYEANVTAIEATKTMIASTLRILA